MAGRFINQKQQNTIDSLVDSLKSILDNPYYLYSDKKAAVADYWNINTTKTTLDEATRDRYAELNSNSPIRYNHINNMMIYGITRMDLDYDIGEFGLESSEITGECIILPNTIVPYVGDYFRLHQLKNPYLFRITKVDENVIESSAILYKCSYKLEYTDLHGIENQTVASYNMILNNVGSNYKAVIQSNVYDLIDQLEHYTTRLKDYYNMIFYDERVQTYTYLHNGLFKVYDPYLVEFLIRNEILNGATRYIYVSHQMYLPNTFSIDYNTTFFAALEEQTVDRFVIKFIGNYLKCTQKLSLLYAYPDDYYYVEYKQLAHKFYSVEMIDIDMIDRIRNLDYGKDPMDNIMIKYFNGIDLTFEDVYALNGIDYNENKDLYYKIPITIFCIERAIIHLLSKEKTSE